MEDVCIFILLCCLVAVTFTATVTKKGEPHKDTVTYLQDCKRTDVVLAATKSIDALDSESRRGYWIQLTCTDGTVIYEQPK